MNKICNNSLILNNTQLTLPWTNGNLLATIVNGPVAVIPGVQDCTQLPALGADSVGLLDIENGLFALPEAYLNDIIARLDSRNIGL